MTRREVAAEFDRLQRAAAFAPRGLKQRRMAELRAFMHAQLRQDVARRPYQRELFARRAA